MLFEARSDLCFHLKVLINNTSALTAAYQKAQSSHVCMSPAASSAFSWGVLKGRAVQSPWQDGWQHHPAGAEGSSGHSAWLSQCSVHLPQHGAVHMPYFTACRAASFGSLRVFCLTFCQQTVTEGGPCPPPWCGCVVLLSSALEEKLIVSYPHMYGHRGIFLVSSDEARHYRVILNEGTSSIRQPQA